MPQNPIYKSRIMSRIRENLDVVLLVVISLLIILIVLWLSNNMIINMRNEIGSISSHQ